MTQPPSDAAMRAAHEVVDVFISVPRFLTDATATLLEIQSQVAAVIDKHLPVSEQGRDATQLQQAAKLVCGYCDGHHPQFNRQAERGPSGSGNWIHQHEGGQRSALCAATGIFNKIAFDAGIAAAATPPPASDERCVRCGEKIYQADTSSGPKWGHVDADTECSDPAPSVPAGDAAHHKHCSSWTVTTSGEKKPCDCVCQCSHSMFQHIRPGEHYWYEDCAVDGCPCMKFAAATEPAPSSGAEGWLAQIGFADSRTYSSVEIAQLLTQYAEATRTAIVGRLRMRAAEYDSSKLGIRSADCLRAAANVFERTPLDELMKGGE